MKSILNESQIERIADTVSKSAIASAEMKEDLIDHLCCIAEDEMSKGKDFETVFQTVLPKRLNEIQNETVFLFTSKSKRRLDIALFASGLGALTGALATVVMKMLHLPFAQLVFLITVCLVLSVVIPVLFIRTFKKAPEKRISFFGFKGILFYTGVLLCFVSGVFTLAHWPGSFVVLLSAVIFIYLALFPLFFVKIFTKSR